MDDVLYTRMDVEFLFFFRFLLVFLNEFLLGILMI
jgi:hypothetical protein